MKHRFLLDENILHFAIKGVDNKNRPDTSSTELVRLIGQNCHKIVVNKFLLDRYWLQIVRIQKERVRFATEPVSFINELLRKAEKWSFEYADCPDVPEAAKVPAEDIEIVKLALLAHVIIVTGDGPLRTAVNSVPTLEIKAITPPEALLLAKDT